MKKAFYLLPLVALMACEKEIDYEIPDPGKRAVLETRMLTGDLLELYLSESVYSLSSEDPSSAGDFDAKLHTNDPNSPFDFIPILIDRGFESQWVYRLDYDLQPGDSYRIEVSKDGLPNASARETVPSAVDIEDLQYDPSTKEFSFTLKDSAATKDYYMISINVLDGDNIFYSTLDLDIEFFDFQGFFGDGETDGRQYGVQGFLSDQNFNGRQRNIKVRVEDTGNPAVFIELRLHHVSESYYRHELTKAAYQSSDGFFSEPVQIYSNVENGYGIMATGAVDVERVQF